MTPVEIGIGIGLALALAAFLLEYIDATLGMGYGTTITPILILFGFEPLAVVPAVLLSQLLAGMSASFFHHRFENVNFSWGKSDLKVMLVLSLGGVAGAIAAVFLALNLSPLVLKIYIGALVTLIGVFMLLTLNRHFTFSWLKIGALGLVAAFNKGLSAGGYGPLVTGGQILTGVEGKRAIGITALAESLVSLVAVGLYLFLKNHNSFEGWQLTPYLIGGAMLSTPLSALTVKKISSRILRVAIAILTLTLGASILVKIFL